MKFKYIVTTLCILFLTTACTATPNIRSNYNQNIDFSHYKTFGFFEKLDTDSRYESLTTQNLKEATINQMTQRGFVLSNNKPDLLVNFRNTVEERQYIDTMPLLGYGGYGYSRYRNNFYYGSSIGYRPYVDNYKEEKLTIDIVDSKSNKVVWQGEAVGRVTETKQSALKVTLHKTVAQIFAKFPFFTQQ
jgi:hypothetical protein